MRPLSAIESKGILVGVHLCLVGIRCTERRADGEALDAQNDVLRKVYKGRT